MLGEASPQAGETSLGVPASLFTVVAEGGGCQCVSSPRNPHDGVTVPLTLIKSDEHGVSSQSAASCPREKLNKGHGRGFCGKLAHFTSRQGGVGHHLL